MLKYATNTYPHKKRKLIMVGSGEWELGIESMPFFSCILIFELWNIFSYSTNEINTRNKIKSLAGYLLPTETLKMYLHFQVHAGPFSLCTQYFSLMSFPEVQVACILPSVCRHLPSSFLLYVFQDLAVFTGTRPLSDPPRQSS